MITIAKLVFDLIVGTLMSTSTKCCFMQAFSAPRSQISKLDYVSVQIGAYSYKLIGIEEFPDLKPCNCWGTNNNNFL